MTKKKFIWNEGLVMDTFGLKKVYAEQIPLLIDWVSANEDLTDIDTIHLEKLRKKAELKIEAWNEEELKMQYLSFIVDYANYSDDEETYNIYFERPISAEVEGHKINVIVDFMIAQGVLEYIKRPYFCFHEYKREKKYNDDPIAQVLLAMLAAREKNKNNKPVYGAYIIGKHWYFMVMENKNFAVSESFSCTDKVELFKIISILRKFKSIIKTQLLDTIQLFT
jgi:hypothetical protein